MNVSRNIMEKYMFNKKLLAASMAAAISTGMVAQSQAMEMQANNVGQMLLAPLYLTTAGDEGLNTEIIVINTRTDAAVKAKIVFREGIYSSEVLDFVLYLTPGDVWRGRVTGATDAAYIESTDDSMVDAGGNFGSVDNPIKQAFFDKLSTGSNGYGHYEVFGAYSVTTGTTTVAMASASSGTVTVKQGMDKRDLRAVFAAVTAGGKASISGGAVASSVDPQHLQIMGETQLVVGDNAVVNYETPAMGPSMYGSACNGTVTDAVNLSQNCVIENTAFDVVVGTETLIGDGFGLLAADAIEDVEQALAATQTYLDYNTANSAITYPIVSFVTKYRHGTLNNSANLAPGTCSTGSTVVPATSPATWNYSSPFQATAIGEMVYSFISYDNSENFKNETADQFSGGTATKLKLPLEVNVLTPSYYASNGSGWASIVWAPKDTSCNYGGVPVLSATLKTVGSQLLWTESGERNAGM